MSRDYSCKRRCNW